MVKSLKLRVKSAVAKGRKILRRKLSKVAGKETTRGHQLSRLKKISEKMRLKSEPNAKAKKKRQQTLKIMKHAFEGSFNVTMKNTADFIKKSRKKRQTKTIL